MCVSVHVCLDALLGGGVCVGVFRNKLGVRGRRVDARMGELRGRSVRVTREEEGVWG